MAGRGGWRRKRSAACVAGRMAILAALAMGAAGCGVPRSMEVRTGVEPRYEDDDVRFRTTYFFRVFDYCSRPDRAADDPNFIKIDSLYRFRMTGKANALFNKVAFESGTLKSYEIDPLGAAVAYDKTNRRFYFQSRAQSERAAACAERDAELARLSAQYAAFAKDTTAGDIKAAIQERIKSVLGNGACTAGDLPSPASRASGADPSAAVQLAGYKLMEAGKALAGVPAVKTTILEFELGTTLAGQVEKAGTTLAKAETGKLVAAVTSAAQSLTAAGKQLAAVKPKGAATGQANAAVPAAAPAVPVQAADAAAAPPAAPATPAAPAKSAPDMASPIKAGLGDAGNALQRAGDDLTNAGKTELAGAGYVVAAGRDLETAADHLRAVAQILADNQGGLENAVSPGGQKDDIKKAADELKAAADKLRQAARDLARIAAVTACGQGEVLRRGFQVLGPEGFRTFDQDDRLIMAMSSDAAPLIAQLKDIAGRVLAEQTPAGDALLALVKARLKVAQTLKQLDQAYGEGGGKISPDNLDESQNAVDKIAETAKGATKP